MSNYPAYPGGTPGPMPQPSPPESVLNAVKLMYVGAGLSALSTVVGLLTIGRIRSAVEQASPGLGTDAVNAAVGVAIAAVVVGGLIGVALWLWMASANKKGYSWARITGTVFFGINAFGLLFALSGHTTAASKALALLVWLAGLGAVVLLWRGESGAYFNRSPGGYPPPGGYPGYPPPGGYPGYPQPPGAPPAPGGQWDPPSP